ncbi:deoxyribodipyrimidine photo-lyase [Vibrio sp. FNV 38]|nr:deoxyribodipyrimidine photo-lyase [Vibrio sp. FNV 38]
MELIWFRRDLRVDDNPSLQLALNAGNPVVAIYIATPVQWTKQCLAPRQADLIWRRIEELQQDLKNLNIPLLYIEVDGYSDAVRHIVNLCQQYGVMNVYANREYEINEVERDHLLQASLNDVDVSVHLSHDRGLTIPGSVMNKQGKYFKVFTPFKKALLAQWQLKPISKVAACQHAVMQDYSRDEFNPQNSVFSYPRDDSHAWPCSTQAIRQQLRDYCIDRVADYQLERDFPAKPATSRLSPFLAIGALSPSQCVARLYANGEYLTEGGSTWLSELIWRDFYQHLVHFEPKLCKHKDFVNWGVNVKWDYSQQRLECWKNGATGYPIVDAAMRQLNQTGWMHNRLRMVVASFLTKDLHLDWRLGEEYFMSKLIDGDYASNNGGWQWCASTGCDGQPYFRIFNPISQGERFDSQGEFVRHWIPELKAVPNRHIHAPWKWSEFESVDYPPPIVDHKAEREITLALYKEAKDFS